MTLDEQILFLIAIGGFLVFLEGAIAIGVRFIAKRFKKFIPADTMKIIVGLGILIFVLALLHMPNL